MVAMLWAVSLSAQTTAREWLDGLDSSLGERFGVNISVTMPGSESLDGYFMVEGDGFYLTLGVMEVYSDGRLRYEINNERKEVSEDVVDGESVDLLTNPTRAFDFVDEQFESSVAKSLEAGVIVLLKPLDEDMGISYIALNLGKRDGRVVPRAIVYDYDGDLVTIRLTLTDVSDAKLPRWNKEAYRAYDLVSYL